MIFAGSFRWTKIAKQEQTTPHPANSSMTLLHVICKSLSTRDRFHPGLIPVIIALLIPILKAQAPVESQAALKSQAIGDTVSSNEALIDDKLQVGASIYRAQCASCHGEHGEGVAKAFPNPLVGDASIRELSKLISDTMPEDDPAKCVGSDAEAVAMFIHERFYSDEAQIRNKPPRIGLARLTGTQLRQSLADLYSFSSGVPAVTEGRGIKGLYFDGARFKKENKKIERVDSQIDFDFGQNSPGEGIDPKAFYIYWEGGLLAHATGRYEIIVRSTCSFVMDFGRIGRVFIDNHVQSGDKTEFRQSIHLTAGRVYPFKIDFIQRERKTEKPPAKISLSWVTPQNLGQPNAEELIPEKNLVTAVPPPTFSLQGDLPADDRSYGFERGVAIDRQWDESTTAAGIEFANAAAKELWPEYQKKHKKDGDENRSKLRSFLTEIVGVAFRGELGENARKIYIDHRVDATQDDVEAIKRSLLAAVKSPRFLYPTADQDHADSDRVASRLALVLHDSLPIQDWAKKKTSGMDLEKDEKVRQLARAWIQDYRAQAKIRDLMQEWLNIRQPRDIAKDEKIFAGFDHKMVSDLRQSIELFLDQVVWSEASDFRQLFQADWAPTNDRLSTYYGEAWMPLEPIGSEPVSAFSLVNAARSMRKSVSDPAHRFGVLTHPYMMSSLSYHQTTSPIHRGVFLIRNVLGRTLRPPNEAFSPISPDLHPDLTTRERVGLQTSPESCQVCHAKINRLGFALENFDAVGRFRVEEKSKGVDASGGYSDRLGNEVRFCGASELAAYIIQSEDVHRAFVNRAFLHLVKQPVAAYGPKTLDELISKFRESNFNMRELFVEIAVIAATQARTIK